MLDGKDASRKLARYAAGLQYDAIPLAMRELTKQCVLDTLGVAIGASGVNEEARLVHEYVSDLGGKAESTIWGFGGKALRGGGSGRCRRSFAAPGRRAHRRLRDVSGAREDQQGAVGVSDGLLLRRIEGREQVHRSRRPLRRRHVRAVFVMGSSRTRTPMALKTAFAITARVGTIGGSPMPAVEAVLVFAALFALAENQVAVLPNRASASASFMLAMAAIVAFQGQGPVLGALLVGLAGGLYWPHLRSGDWRKILFNSSNFAPRVRSIAAMSASTSVFIDTTVATTCTSLMNPSGNSGRIGRSIRRDVSTSFSDGRPSRLKKPPGMRPAA